MKLLTKAILKKLPKLYETDGIPLEEKVAIAKLFDPSGRLTYYITEFDGKDIMFGYMVSPLGSDCDEWGYSSLAELAAVKGRFELGIERDCHFKPTIMKEILNK